MKIAALTTAVALSTATAALAQPDMLAALRAANMPKPNVEQVKKALDLKLIDYSRARFRDVHVVRTIQLKRGQATGVEFALCGMVNGPNRAGAMVGWTRFATSVIGGEVHINDFVTDRVCDTDDKNTERQVGDIDYADQLAPGAS